MLASFKGPSVFGVLLGNAPNSVGKGAAAILFSYGGGLSGAQLACMLLLHSPLFRPQELGMPPLFSIGRGHPVAELAKGEVDLRQE